MKRFRFVSPGEVLVGVVRGKDDSPVLKLAKLLADQARAVNGLSSITCFEPKTGHIAVYCEYQDSESPGRAEIIDLSNPALQILELVTSGEPVLRIGRIVFRDEEKFEVAQAA